jgi:hypothetical protein
MESLPLLLIVIGSLLDEPIACMGRCLRRSCAFRSIGRDQFARPDAMSTGNNRRMQALLFDVGDDSRDPTGISRIDLSPQVA